MKREGGDAKQVEREEEMETDKLHKEEEIEMKAGHQWRRRQRQKTERRHRWGKMKEMDGYGGRGERRGDGDGERQEDGDKGKKCENKEKMQKGAAE